MKNYIGIYDFIIDVLILVIMYVVSYVYLEFSLFETMLIMLVTAVALLMCNIISILNKMAKER